MKTPASKPRVLILCTGNSCRSHMAEGILRAAAGDILEVHSAGSRPAGFVHPKAIAVLAEIGISTPQSSQPIPSTSRGRTVPLNYTYTLPTQ